MKFIEDITNIFKRGRKLYNGASASLAGSWSGIGTLPFADLVFYNCVDLLVDLCHDVTWTFDGRQKATEAAFVRFFNTYGKVVLGRLYRDGVVVLKHTTEGMGDTAAHDFSIADNSDYMKQTVGDWTTYTPIKQGIEIYAMRSSTYQMHGRSDRDMCLPFLTFIDNTLNSSNTVSERMGATVVCSPKNITSAPMPINLREEEKKALEDQLAKDYGALHHQKQVMVLPREMSWQVISLASIDVKVQEKVKMAVTAIADRIKVPANQVALIDANSSKSLSNGTELREGDYNKYQSFERLLDQTFVQMAKDCGLTPVAHDDYYTIYNKPQQPAAPSI